MAGSRKAELPLSVLGVAVLNRLYNSRSITAKLCKDSLRETGRPPASAMIKFVQPTWGAE